MNKVYIVTPTYNEKENLPILVEALVKVLEKEGFRLIVVDDGSEDGTAHVAEELNTRYGNILIHCRACKLGIGSAIQEGLKIALSFPDCEYIVTLDADLSHSPKDTLRLLSHAENADLVQGSRYVKGGKIVGWSFFRRTISYVANLFCGLFLRTYLNEHTTNFRVYSRKCAESIIAGLDCDGYEWFIGSILEAKDRNFSIREVPITFVQRVHGKSKLDFSEVLKWTSYIFKTFVKRSLYRIWNGISSRER